MNIKFFFYFLMLPVVIWAFESIDFNKIFKKNKYYQARVLYVLLVLITSYMLVNFIFDFINNVIAL